MGQDDHADVLKQIMAGSSGNPSLADIQLSNYGYDSTGRVNKRDDRFERSGTIEKFSSDLLG